MKLKNSNCDKKKIKNQNSNRDKKIKTPIVMKLKHSICDETQKLKL